ncbi:MAG: metallophosphoesterase, partial [Salaquimonas sp.]
RGARDKALAAWQEWICGDAKVIIKSEADYPIVRRRGRISLIGCNSARASAPFLATGYFKKGQADALEAILSAEKASGQCCIVLIHHPPVKSATQRYKRLLGAKRLRAVIARKGADLILHGHTHLQTLSYLEGPDKQVPVVCVPAAYQWHGHKKPPSGLNLFDIKPENGKWMIKLERHGLTFDGSNTTQPTFNLLEERIL